MNNLPTILMVDSNIILTSALKENFELNNVPFLLEPIHTVKKAIERIKEGGYIAAIFDRHMSQSIEEIHESNIPNKDAGLRLKDLCASFKDAGSKIIIFSDYDNNKFSEKQLENVDLVLTRPVMPDRLLERLTNCVMQP